MENLKNKILKAAKWSAITEIIAKLITPITNIILARIIAPEAFGVVATITMIISFADMFTDAGFQKYLVQHEFKSDEEKNIYTNVAFWTNLIISLLMWGLIIIFSDQIASMVGNPGLGDVISIACSQLILTSFSSIQMAIYRREFDFKTLFLVRIVSIFIPFVVTIPLAFLGYSYWSLIIGTICGTLSNAFILTIKSKWKPKFVYSFSALKEMLSFSIWSLIEAISIWMTTWIDTFIIGSILSPYYVGVYKTSISSVNSIFGIVTGSTTSILFSALSRVQDDTAEFDKIFFSMQRLVAYLVLPISIGMFLYSDIVVKVFLGNKWEDANHVMGIWSLMSGIVIVLGHYSSEVYRAKGRPKLSFISQMMHLIVLIPICIIAANYDFITLVNMRAIVRLQAVMVHLFIMQFIIGISIKKVFKNILAPAICAIIMGIIGFVLISLNQGFIWKIISIFICTICYFVGLVQFKGAREDMIMISEKFNLIDKLEKNNILNLKKLTQYKN